MAVTYPWSFHSWRSDMRDHIPSWTFFSICSVPLIGLCGPNHFRWWPLIFITECEFWRKNGRYAKMQNFRDRILLSCRKGMRHGSNLHAYFENILLENPQARPSRVWVELQSLRPHWRCQSFPVNLFSNGFRHNSEGCVIARFPTELLTMHKWLR